jgi:hypothetical protein
MVMPENLEKNTSLTTSFEIRRHGKKRNKIKISGREWKVEELIGIMGELNV